MAKWSGQLGFVKTTEEPAGSGLWKQIVTIRKYKGDVTRSSKRVQTAPQLNNNITVNNEISILADPYICENFYAITFIRFMNAWWSVNSVTMDYPRITLEIGGVYNGDTTPTS